MFDHIDMCREWIKKPTTRRYPGFKVREKDRKHTPIIMDAKKSLDQAQSEIELGNEWVFVLNKKVNRLKYREAPMKEIKKMIDICLAEKRTVTLLIQESKKCTEQLQIVKHEVEVRRKLLQDKQSVAKKKISSRK